MAKQSDAAVSSVRIQNYRALRDVTFNKLTPLTVLLGANGSGKSTVFDVFAFLNEAFTDGLRSAWDRRNRIEGIRSLGQTGPVEFELKYRAPYEGKYRLARYTLAVDQESSGPVITEERLTWTISPGSGRPKDILRFSRGAGKSWDEESAQEKYEELSSPDVLAVSALGQFRRHPRVQYLRDFISGWYLSYISADNTRTTPIAVPARRLSKSGDNLPNVIQYLEEEHPQRLQEIFRVLSERVPQLEKVTADRLDDGRLLLRIKDRSFDRSILSRFASDGTLKLLAYLVVLMDPEPPPVIGIEEPENQLHPKLLPILAEEIRAVAGRSQTFVTTHSPEFVSAIKPRELWMISRGDDGYARVSRASDSPVVTAMMEQEGANLGDLWSERYLSEADPRNVH